MRETAGASARIATVLKLARSGQPGEAAAAARRLLAEVGTAPSALRAFAEYALAVAAHHGGNSAESLDAVDACIRIARIIDEPGWEANALTLRIVTLVRSGAGGDSVADLVAAENALARTGDAGLARWAHSGLGEAYDLLRLFELCIPHFERAASAPRASLDAPESAAIDRLNLAEVNLRWAHEMERLGDPAFADRIRHRRRVARRWATEAMDVIVHDDLTGYWPVVGRMWLAASHHDLDPGGSVVVLTDCCDRLAELGDPARAAVAGAYLARSYAALGRAKEALDAADRAGTGLPPASDPPVEALVRHTAVQIAADSGDAGAAAGLQYARAVTRGWWAERLRGLYAVRSALASHELSLRHDAEWRAAREDPLTGVGNRRALDERMARAVPSDRATAVIVIDVDNLKLTNDSYGHNRGDVVLRRVARLLVDQSRADDVVARSGGDEFVVVLDNADERGAQELMDRITAAAEHVRLTTEEPWFTTLRLSVGCAATADGTPVADLLPRADARMYADKGSRRR